MNYDICKTCSYWIPPQGATYTGNACMYGGRHPGYTSTRNIACGVCGSTAIDHTEAQCSLNRIGRPSESLAFRKLAPKAKESESSDA